MISNWPTMDWVFLICAVVGGIAFLLWLVLQFVGGVFEGGVDIEADVDAHAGDVSGQADIGFTLLSFQGLSSFLTMFGLVGLACSREVHTGAALALLFGGIAGLAMAWVIGRLFRVFVGFQSSGTLDMNSAVGAEGQVYLRIAPGDIGKVRITLQGRVKVLDCRSTSPNVIESGTRVRVSEVLDGHTLVVEAVK